LLFASVILRPYSLSYMQDGYRTIANGFDLVGGHLYTIRPGRCVGELTTYSEYSERGRAPIWIHEFDLRVEIHCQLTPLAGARRS